MRNVNIISEGERTVNEEKERIVKLITNNERWSDQLQDEEPSVDYAAEYKKQTGRDLETGKFITQ